MNYTDLSQVHSLEEATELFEQAFDCIAMGNYKQHNQAENIIQSIICHPSSDDIFKCTLYKSTNSYCIFYSAKLLGLSMMKKWYQLSFQQQIEFYDHTRSISEFGFSEIELVLSVFLKQLWGANPGEISPMFFNRLGSPTWRSMKLLQSLLTTMKCNDITDFTIPKETHNSCLKAFYENGIKQAAQWIVSALMLFCSSYPEMPSEHQREELQLSLDLFSNILSWNWPSTSPNKSVTKTGLQTNLVAPDVTFEPIFIQEQILLYLQKIYFTERFELSLPQSIFSVMTLLGSYSPHSFMSTRTHAQHLHRVCDFAFSVIDASYLSVASSRGISDAEAMEGDLKEKLRVAVLLKAMLCTQASTVMMYLPTWSSLVQKMLHFVKLLHEDLIRIIQTPSLADDCVDLLQSCEEVIGESLDIVSYWCDSDSIRSTLGDFPIQIYTVCLHTRLEMSVLVLRYSTDEAGNEKLWNELEQRDQNEDNWTFNEEQSAIGRVGRWNPSETCTLLVNVLNDICNQLKQCDNESLMNILEEKLYWLIIFIDHFVSDYDSTEIPLQFEAIQSTPDYPLLSFMDVCNASILTLMSTPSIELSSLVLQVILSYLSHFIQLYLDFRPQLAMDFFNIIASTLSNDALSNIPYAACIHTLQLLLEKVVDQGVGSLNEGVWREIVSSLIDFAQNYCISGKLLALNSMPITKWKQFTTTVLINMQKIGGEYINAYNQFLSTVLSQLSQLPNMTGFEDYIKSYRNYARTQGILAITRGITLVTPLSPSSIQFLMGVLDLLPSLFHQIALHEDLQLIILKLLSDYSKVLLSLSEAQTIHFIQTLHAIAEAFVKGFPSDSQQLHKRSSFIGKALGILFKTVSQLLANASVITHTINSLTVLLYCSLLRCIYEELSYYPIFMNVVMQASVAVTTHCISGFDNQDDALLSAFFSFMIGAYNVFDCEFRALECLHLVFEHCLSIRDGSVQYLGDQQTGIIHFLENNPHVIEKVFTVTFEALFSSKTGMATKDGVDQRTSNLFLVLIACARNDIERIFRQYYQELLVQHPTLLDGILNEKSLMGYKERHIRYNYNRSFTHFYQIVQQYNENKAISN